MKRTKPLVYADTSVFGGVFDEEYRRASQAFFQAVRNGRLRLATSEIVEQELKPAPERVRTFFDKMLPWMQSVALTQPAITLRTAYIAARIVAPQSAADALHVALATVSGCSAVVSWNCRHIVHFQRIPRYNAVNRLEGWGEIAIHTPLEVIANEDEDL